MISLRSLGSSLGRTRKTSKQDENWLNHLRFLFLPWIYAAWKFLTSRKKSKMWFILVFVFVITLFVLLLYSSLWVAAATATDRATRSNNIVEDDVTGAFQIPKFDHLKDGMQVTIYDKDAIYKGQKMNPHDFAYVINEEEICSSSWKLGGGGGHQHQSGSSSSPFLLIFVLSNLRNFERRLAIRQSWGNSKNLMRLNVRLVFLTGVSKDGIRREHQKRLRGESSEFRDILQEDFVDSYMNLTLKSVMGLKWMTNFCPLARYVMKTDDDIYVNVALLVEFLHTLGRRRRYIGGCIKQMRSPLPFNRLGERMSSMTIMGHPPFAAGAGYVISGDLVPQLYEASLRRHLVPVEDAFVTAYCALMVGVTPEHDDRFNCGEPVNNDCQMAFKFVGHHVTPERQLRIHGILNGNGNVCKMLN